MSENRTYPRWPVWPLLATTALALASGGLGVQRNWMADLLALLTILSGLELATAVLARSRLRERPRWRWTLLAAALGAVLALGIALQALTWPVTQLPHPAWLIPTVGLGFGLLRLLPQELNLEAARRARAVLAAEQTRHRSERQLLELRLAALQGQIEPHFLYNTLANARTLIAHDASAAEAMLNHLIAYLRAAVPDLRASATSVEQELARASAYLDIMKIRMGKRLSFEIEASDEAAACLIPPLALMTLIENAIEHGIAPLPDGGQITVRAHCEDARLTLSVGDNGAGFQAASGDGIGLVNLQERLHTLFGARAELRLATLDTGGVNAIISMPAQLAVAA
jgi:signal transduction histidine kinase